MVSPPTPMWLSACTATAPCSPYSSHQISGWGRSMSSTGGTVGVAEREYRSSSLDVVQRRHRPGEGLELRPVIDVEATAVFEIVLVTLGHARGLRIR